MFAMQSWNLDAEGKNNYNKAISGGSLPQFALCLSADRND